MTTASDPGQWLNWDGERRERCGFPEFVYGAGKSAAQLCAMLPSLLETGETILITRLSPEKGEALQATCPDGVFDPAGGTFLRRPPDRPWLDVAPVAVVGAGTSDLAVACEARTTLEACDCRSTLILDVGVAGLHRLLARLDELRRASAVIVIAGMEGALPSVVGGLLPNPIIAVPTSVGYGTARGGETALFAMLNSCAAGVTVVNIDNGFGAACAAARMLRRAH